MSQSTRRVSWHEESSLFVERLPTASFSFVMATGVVSIAANEQGVAWLSTALGAVAAVALVILAAALLMRAAVFPRELMADVVAPERVFGFFTITAGIDVVAIRIADAGHPALAAFLGAIGTGVWLFFCYAVPARLLLARETRSLLEAVDGSWLLLVVSTQSVSILAATLAGAYPTAPPLASIATGLWCVAVMLYLVLVSLILVQLLLVPVSPSTLGPSYWLLMGAAAISVVGGARILLLPRSLAIHQAVSPFVAGASFLLWAFGSWWIPLLIAMGVWRHVMRGWALRYESGMWSIVFPLGMYSLAARNYGQAERLSYLEPIARGAFWVAVISWAVLASSLAWRTFDHLAWHEEPREVQTKRTASDPGSPSGEREHEASPDAPRPPRRPHNGLEI